MGYGRQRSIIPCGSEYTAAQGGRKGCRRLKLDTGSRKAVVNIDNGLWSLAVRPPLRP